MTGDLLSGIWTAQEEFQLRLGHDVRMMTGAQRMEYIRLNILALEDELHEALAETNWKPWSKAEPGFRDVSAYQGELIDCLCFLVNLMLVSGMTYDEAADRYAAKMSVNHARQDAGYDGSDKCDHCKRALDEPQARSLRLTDGQGFTFCSGECMASFDD